MNKIDTKEL